MSYEVFNAEFAPDDGRPATGLWRDGKLLVVELAAHQFPNRCLKSDVPVRGPHTLVEPRTYNVLADELNLVTGLVVASTGRSLSISRNNKGNNVVTPLAVPLAPGMQARLKSWLGLFLAISGIVFTIACFVTMLFLIQTDWFIIPMIGCGFGVFWMIFGFVWMTLRTYRVLSIQRLADRKVWLRGVHRDWLARLPEYKISPELLGRDYKRAVTSTWWSFGTAIVFGIAAIVCVPLSIVGYYHGLASRDWPSVQGSVHGANITTGRTKSGRYWNVNYDYRFTINGQTYSGHESDRHSNEFDAQNNLNSKQDGTPITVFYNPDIPGDNRLQPGISDGEILLIIAAVIVSLISTIAAGYGVAARSRAGRCRNQIEMLAGPPQFPPTGYGFPLR